MNKLTKPQLRTLRNVEAGRRADDTGHPLFDAKKFTVNAVAYNLIQRCIGRGWLKRVGENATPLDLELTNEGREALSQQ